MSARSRCFAGWRASPCAARTITRPRSLQAGWAAIKPPPSWNFDRLSRTEEELCREDVQRFKLRSHSSEHFFQFRKHSSRELINKEFPLVRQHLTRAAEHLGTDLRRQRRTRYSRNDAIRRLDGSAPENVPNIRSRSLYHVEPAVANGGSQVGCEITVHLYRYQGSIGR